MSTACVDDYKETVVGFVRFYVESCVMNFPYAVGQLLSPAGETEHIPILGSLAKLFATTRKSHEVFYCLPDHTGSVNEVCFHSAESYVGRASLAELLSIPVRGSIQPLYHPIPYGSPCCRVQ